MVGSSHQTKQITHEARKKVKLKEKTRKKKKTTVNLQNAITQKKALVNEMQN